MPSVITWANVDPDLCRQVASLGYNELNIEKNNGGWTLHISSLYLYTTKITSRKSYFVLFWQWRLSILKKFNRQL